MDHNQVIFQRIATLIILFLINSGGFVLASGNSNQSACYKSSCFNHVQGMTNLVFDSDLLFNQNDSVVYASRPIYDDANSQNLFLGQADASDNETDSFLITREWLENDLLIDLIPNFEHEGYGIATDSSGKWLGYLDWERGDDGKLRLTTNIVQEQRGAYFDFINPDGTSTLLRGDISQGDILITGWSESGDRDSLVTFTGNGIDCNPELESRSSLLENPATALSRQFSTLAETNHGMTALITPSSIIDAGSEDVLGAEIATFENPEAPLFWGAVNAASAEENIYSLCQLTPETSLYNTGTVFWGNDEGVGFSLDQILNSNNIEIFLAPSSP